MTEKCNLSNLAELLTNNSELLQQLIDAIPIPIFYKDVQGVYLGCNQHFEQFIQCPRQDIVGKSIFQLYSQEQAILFHDYDLTLFREPGVQIYETEFKTYQGSKHYVKFHRTTFVDGAGKVAGLIGVIFDVTAQKELEFNLHELANHDQLTGFYNRREGENIARKLQSTKDRTNVNYCLLLADIDFFKQINDQYGHTVGDNALRHISALFTQECREYDTLIRFGGEEFIILLPTTELADAYLIAERYRLLIEQTPLVINEQQNLNMTISFGVSVSQKDSLEDLFKRADKALYCAKNTGRNRVEIN